MQTASAKSWIGAATDRRLGSSSAGGDGGGSSAARHRPGGGQASGGECDQHDAGSMALVVWKLKGARGGGPGTGRATASIAMVGMVGVCFGGGGMLRGFVDEGNEHGEGGNVGATAGGATTKGAG